MHNYYNGGRAVLIRRFDGHETAYQGPRNGVSLKQVFSAESASGLLMEKKTGKTPMSV